MTSGSSLCTLEFARDDAEPGRTGPSKAEGAVPSVSSSAGSRPDVDRVSDALELGLDRRRRFRSERVDHQANAIDVEDPRLVVLLVVNVRGQRPGGTVTVVVVDGRRVLEVFPAIAVERDLGVLRDLDHRLI